MVTEKLSLNEVLTPDVGGCFFGIIKKNFSSNVQYA